MQPHQHPLPVSTYEQVYQAWPKNIQHIMLVIVMETEAKDLVGRIGLKHDASNDGNPFLEAYTGVFSGKTVTVVKPPSDPIYKNVQAVGTEPAALCLYAAYHKYKPDVVISAGTSGGVARPGNAELKLAIGDVIIARKCQFFTRTIIVKEWEHYLVGEEYKLLDPKPIQNVLGLKPAVIGTQNSFTSDNILAAAAGIDIVEMEAAAELRVAHFLNVPYTAIKIVSDVEMHNEEEREKLFDDFFTVGIKALAAKLQLLIENIDEISKQ